MFMGFCVRAIRLHVLLGLLAVVSVSSFAVAQPQNASTAKGGSALSRLMQDFKVGSFGWSYGPSVTGFNSGRIPQMDGRPAGQSGIWTQLTPRVPAFGGFEFVVVPTFLVQPFDSLRPFQMLNPTVGLTGMLYTGPAFSWWTRAEVVVPVTDVSRRDGLLPSPQMVNVFSYRELGSPWDARVVFLPFENLFSDGSRSGGLYLSPLLFYHVNSNLAGVALGEIFTSRPKNAALSAMGQFQPSYAGLGFRYTWNSGRFIQPYLNSFADRPTLQNTGIAVIFGGPILN